jgi:hypothetical protein
MKSIHKSNFFDNETFTKIKENVLEKINDKYGLSYGKDCTREYRIVFLSDEIQNILLDKAKQETKNNSLEIIYNQIVRYQIKNGIIPELKPHKDKAVGEWVMDIVLDATVDWPLVIQGESFSNTTNSVTFICGEDELHWRDAFPSESEKEYVLLLFVHLADKDSRYAKVSREIFDMGEERANAFLRSAVPSWGGYRSL